jgi:hypothetical protein
VTVHGAIGHDIVSGVSADADPDLSIDGGPTSGHCLLPGRVEALPSKLTPDCFVWATRCQGESTRHGITGAIGGPNERFLARLPPC